LYLIYKELLGKDLLLKTIKGCQILFLVLDIHGLQGKIQEQDDKLRQAGERA
jgi:hypothetical protein